MTVPFAQLGLAAPLVAALRKQDIIETFPIQASTLPDALAGRDVAGKAPTGSGKTLAFGLAVVSRVERARPKRPRALILAPTRELADQIKKELTPLARAMKRSVIAIYGGVSYKPQRDGLRRGADVVVATPGRLEDLIEQRAINLRDVSIAVVDEADRMADMGFLPAVRRILDDTSRDRQTLLFSATLDREVAVLKRDYQDDPVTHEAASIEPDTTEAEHHFWLVEQTERIDHVASLIAGEDRSIVFTRTRHGADRLAKQLSKRGVGAVAMHGGRSQNQRNRALKAFADGGATALVATDVAARGIHVDAVSCVVHFDPPGDAKDYVHRSGRTARAGAAGKVVSLVTPQQRRGAQRLARELGLSTDFGSGGESGERTSRPGRRRRNEPRRPSRDSVSLYVANLPWSTREPDVERLFGRFGKVHQATIITDRRSGRSRGFGFVDMPQAAATLAVEALQGSRFEGRDLTVRKANPRR